MTYLCVCRLQKECDYGHANWQLIEADTRNKARHKYCQLDSDVDYKNVLASVCTDKTMEAKLIGQGHPLAVARD